MRFKLVLCDLDGTLLYENKQLDSEIIEVKKQLDERGILFTLVSGRNVHIMDDIVKELDIQIPYVTNNGGNIFLGKRCICEFAMNNEDLLNVFQLLEEYQIPYLAYTNQAVYSRGKHEVLDQFMKRLIGKVEIIANLSCELLARQSIFKIVIVQEDEKMMAKIMENINNRCHKAHCVRSEGDVYTLTHIDASKGNAVKRLLEILSLKKEEVIAFGDNYNDISMFEAVGYSVAMGNADVLIQEKADDVTLSNEQNGVSDYLKRYLLK